MDAIFHLQYATLAIPAASSSSLIDFTYSVIAFLYYTIIILFSFSPFFLVLKKWHPATWWKATGATVLAALLFFGVVWPTINQFVGIWLDDNVRNGVDLSPMTDWVLFPLGPLVSIFLIFSPFLWVRWIYHQYTWKRFFVALFCAFILLAIALFAGYELLLMGARELPNYL